MGVKSRLEGKLRRAQQEGRTEDAEHLQELLKDLMRTRGDAAFARGNQTGTYQVRSGDTAFSIAQSQLGDEDLLSALMQANPGVEVFKPGMLIKLPNDEDFEAYKALQRAEGRAGAAAGGVDPDLLFPETPPAPEALEENQLVDQTVQALLAMQQTNPVAFNQLAPAFGLEPMAIPGVPIDGEVGLTGTHASASAIPSAGNGFTAATVSQPMSTPAAMPTATSTATPTATPAATEPHYSTWEERQKERAAESQQATRDSEQPANQFDLTEWIVIDMVNTAVTQMIAEPYSMPRFTTAGPFGLSALSGGMIGEGVGDISRAYNLFASGAPKDVKIQIKNRLGEGVVVCGENGCRWVDSSVPGNIIFGYNMSAGRIPSEIYTVGAGLAQTQDDWPETPSGFLRDNPEDAAAVSFGAYLFAKYGTSLTVAQFKSELTADILDSFQSPPSGFYTDF